MAIADNVGRLNLFLTVARSDYVQFIAIRIGCSASTHTSPVQTLSDYVSLTHRTAQPDMFILGYFRYCENKKKAQRSSDLGLSTDRNPQWLINLGQAEVELRRRGPRLCKMCQKNPAEFGGYCGECYNKLKESKKGPVRKRWHIALSHLFE